MIGPIRFPDGEWAVRSGPAEEVASEAAKPSIEKEWTMGEFVTVEGLREVREGELARFKVGGERIAVANVSGTLHAFDDTCTHLGCSLAEGELEGAVVTCPCHGSQFDVSSGCVLRGPAQEPVRSYAVHVDNEVLQVEL